MLNGRNLAIGLFIGGLDSGSCVCCCPRKNILLFLTRDAFIKFSREERRVGEGDAVLFDMFSVSKMPGDRDSRCLQLSRGELFLGDASKGEESRFGDNPLKAVNTAACTPPHDSQNVLWSPD